MNICVDLGSVKSVDAVSVDAKSVSRYTYDPETHILTVPCLTTTAKLLTVTELREDGSLYFSTYQLEWDSENGYSAHVVYSNRDLLKSFLMILNMILQAIKNLLTPAPV